MPIRLLILCSVLALSQSAVAAALAQASEKPKAPIVWSYDDDYTGQEEWELLTPAFAACGIGTQQSPINISRTIAERAEPPMFHYSPSEATVSNIGYTPNVTFKDALYYEENGTRYKLESIHFHSPSEHVVRGKFYALEIQFMHVSDAGKRLIVSVFSTMKTAKPEFDALLAAIPDKQGVSNTVAFNPALLLPHSFAHYAYTGSLTTPPCTEGIEWRVMKKPISLSKEQITMLSKFTKRNARLTQPIYMRTVKEVN